VATEIRKLGWINLTVWECELKDIEGLKKRIRNELAVIENNSGIK
jgi:G:T-mismatch repair DNA endonuclease (very short patch repair protein)